MNLLKRLETLEAVLGKGQDPNYRILDLISRLSDPGARAELEEIVATRRGSQGMREVAAVLLFGQAQIAELDSAQIAELDSTEGTEVLQ